MNIYAAATAKSLQSCLILCDPIDGSPPGSPRPWDSPGKNPGVGCHFLLQCKKVKSESEVAQSCLTLATPWTAAYQAPLFMGFSRQEYWSGLLLPSPSKKHSVQNKEGDGSTLMIRPQANLTNETGIYSSEVTCPCMHARSLQSCPTLLRPHGLQPTRRLHPWDFPGKSTGVGCHFPLQ